MQVQFNLDEMQETEMVPALSQSHSPRLMVDTVFCRYGVIPPYEMTSVDICTLFDQSHSYLNDMSTQNCRTDLSKWMPNLLWCE